MGSLMNYHGDEDDCNDDCGRCMECYEREDQQDEWNALTWGDYDNV